MPRHREAPAWRTIAPTCGHEETIPELVGDRNPNGTAYVVRILAHCHLHPKDVPSHEGYTPKASGGKTIGRPCDYCGKWFTYRRHGRSGARTYCSPQCAKAAVKRRANMAYRARQEALA